MHPEIDEYLASTRDALQELVNNLETISTQSGIVSGVVDNLTRAMTRLSDHRASLILPDSGTYVDYQTRMVECAKEIAKISTEMVNCKLTLQLQFFKHIFLILVFESFNRTTTFSTVIG